MLGHGLVSPPDAESLRVLRAMFFGEETAAQRAHPGVQYKKEGPLCERVGAKGTCHLEPGYRKRLVQELDTYVPTAVTAYQTALQNARIDELLKKTPQLGIVAELLIGGLSIVATGLLSGAAALAIKELNRRAAWKEVLQPDQFDAAVLAQTTHVRTVIGEATGIAKGRARLAFTGNTPQSKLKESLLAKLQNDIGPTLHAIRHNVLDTGDDAALIVATGLFDPDVFTVDACSHHVRGLIDRLENQHLDEIGPFKSGAVSGAGETQVVKLQSFGQHRLAVINFFHPVKMGHMHGEDWHTRDGEQFLSWVEDDLGDFAASAQESRNGAVKTIDVSLFPERFGPEVNAWVARTRRGAGQ